MEGAAKTVNVYVFFVGKAYSTVEFARVKRDFANANEVWNRGSIFIKIANGNGIPIVNNLTHPNYRVDSLRAEKLGHQHQRGPADRIRNALINDFTPNRSIALFYIPGSVFYGSEITCAVTGSEAGSDSFKSSIFMAADSDYPYILAHELGHALFFRPSCCSIANPGPSYIFPGAGDKDPSHDNRPTNLMYPSVPKRKPRITIEQIIKARKSPYILRSHSLW